MDSLCWSNSGHLTVYCKTINVKHLPFFILINHENIVTLKWRVCLQFKKRAASGHVIRLLNCCISGGCQYGAWGLTWWKADSKRLKSKKPEGSRDSEKIYTLLYSGLQNWVLVNEIWEVCDNVLILSKSRQRKWCFFFFRKL